MSTDLVPAQEFGKFTKEDIESARTVICKGAPDHIIRLILYRCSQLGADPYSRMVYAVERKGAWTLQVSIDMFRATAESAGDYAGQDGPYWCGDDGVWHDVWLDKKHPRAAKVGVLRKGFVQPLYSIANWESYASDFGPMWSKFGPLMIAKCAEALALRRAFPAKLSGLYTSDEMHQAESKSIVLEPAQYNTKDAAFSGSLVQQALQAATLSPAARPAALNELLMLAKSSGKLLGAVNQDLQRLGGDVLALKAEYENALSQKNPRRPVNDTASAFVQTPDAAAVTRIGSLPSNEPAVDGEAGAYTQEHIEVLKGLESPRKEGTAFVPESGDKTRHIMAIMRAFTHPALIAKYGAFESQMALVSDVVGREIMAYSSLMPDEAALVVRRTASMIPESAPATADEIKHLQIVMKDDKLVEWLKTSKRYKSATDSGETQADALRLARLAFSSHVLGRIVESFKECTSEETAKLAQAAKKQASK
jgi:hypothetical protein